MRLLRLRASNFGPFSESGFDLDLSAQGLVSVVGVNNTDPGNTSNGSGKSSILDALMWCLFGETSARKETSSSDSGLKGDEVINEIAGKDCLVEVDFEAKGREFRVRRWRKAKVADGAKRGSGVDVCELSRLEAAFFPLADLDKSNVQEVIDRLLGFDRDLFSQTVVRGQEDAFNFAQATPKDRFEILTRIEGLEDLDVWDGKFRARSRLLAHELAVLQGVLQGKEQTIAVRREQAAHEAAASARWEDDRQGRLSSLAAAHAAALAGLGATDARLSGKADVDARLASVTAELAALALPSAPEHLATWEQYHQGLREALSIARKDRERIAARLQRAAQQRAGDCETCGQAITADHLETHRSQLAAEAAGAEAALQAAVAAEAQAATTIRTARSQVEQAQAQVRDQQRRLDYERSQLLVTVGSFRSDEANRAQIVAQLVRIDADIAATRSAPNPVQAEAPAREAALLALEEDLSAAKAASSLKASEAGLCDWWVRSIPSLKSWIFDSVVGEITAAANKWLAVLTGGLCWIEIAATSTTKGGELRDKISLRCFRWNPDGSTTERDFRQWSGGEKRRFSIAIDWALSARLAQRAKGSCTFLALDEVDRHLDAAGRAGLLAAFDILRQEKETVVVISHDSDFRSKPDRTWLVTKNATGSVVEVVNNG